MPLPTSRSTALSTRPHLRPHRPARRRRRNQVPRRVRRPGDPRRGPGAPGHVGHPPRSAAVRRRPARHQPRRRLQQPQRREARGHDRPPAGARARSCCASSWPSPTSVTENFAAGVMARLGFPYDELRSHQARHRLRVQLGVRPRGPYTTLQDLGADRAGGQRPHVQLRAPRPPAGGLGLLLHGPHGRQLSWRWPSSPGLIHRNRTGEGQWIDMACTEAGSHAVRARPPRLHGERPSAAHAPASPTPTAVTRPAMAPHSIYPARGDRRLGRHRVP